MVLGFTLILCFVAIYLFTVRVCELTPNFYSGIYEWHKKQIAVQKNNLKDMMLFIDPKRLVMLNIVAPLASCMIFALLGLKFGSVIIGLLIGAIMGFLIPSFVIKNIASSRKNKFRAQISDGLMILSSCLKGGFSLLQAIETLVEELPPPISQEFGLILRENKMGMSLEESFEKLNKRLPSEELNLLTTAILVARETGGDITQLFSILINTIRAKIKIQDSVKTLSLQGKIQGVIMSLLPIGFAMMVYSFNPNYFDVMLANPLGRMLLVYAVISEIIGIFLIKVFSKVNL